MDEWIAGVQNHGAIRPTSESREQVRRCLPQDAVSLAPPQHRLTHPPIPHTQLAEHVLVGDARWAGLHKKAFGFLQWGKGEPTIAGWETVRSLMGDAVTAVVTGQMTPQEALDYAVDEANAALAE